MNSTELNKLLWEIQRDLGTYDHDSIVGELIPELQPEELVDAIRIMAPSYIHKVVVQPSPRTVLSEHLRAVATMNESLPAGAYRGTSAKKLGAKHAGVAPYAAEVENTGRATMSWWYKEYVVAEITPEDLLEIASEYYRLSGQIARIGENLSAIAGDLQSRKVKKLGDLPASSLETYLQRLLSIQAEERDLKLAA